MIVKAPTKSGLDTSSTFQEVDAGLKGFQFETEQTKNRAAEHPANAELAAEATSYASRLASCYGKAGEAATFAGAYEQALAYHEQQASLSGELGTYGDISQAAALLGLGRRQEAVDCLGNISGPLTTSGRGLKRVEETEILRAHKAEPGFAGVLQTWSQAR